MRHDLSRAAAFAVLAAAAFAVTGACIKTASVTVGNEMVVFFRCFISFLALLPWAVHAGRTGVATQRLGGHLWRSGLGLAAMYCFFHALAHLPLAEAMLLNYSTPLYVPFIAWFWIRERPPRTALPAALLGLAGVAMIVKPSASGFFSPYAAIGAISGLLAAGAMVGIRRISDTEPTARVVFYFTAIGSLVSAIPLLWAWRTPSAEALGWLVTTGLSATLGQLALTRAYALAPASQVGPFSYTVVIFSGGLGWLFWNERPDAWAVAGGTLVVATCLLLSLRRPEPRLEE